MINLSKRMQAIADKVTVDSSVADIGCDHGFVAIYLAQQKGVKKIFALDVNKGPLLRAKEHIEMNGLSQVIETRLSDGARALSVNESDAAIIAGMGGKLITRILTDSSDKFKVMKEVILSPHSEIDFVRNYLCEEGYEIIDEDMVFDEEKYYQIIKCRYTGDSYSLSDEEKKYGPLNIRNRNQVLKKYLMEQRDKKVRIVKDLTLVLDDTKDEKKEVLFARIEVIKDEIQLLEKVIAKY